MNNKLLLTISLLQILCIYPSQWQQMPGSVSIKGRKIVTTGSGDVTIKGDVIEHTGRGTVTIDGVPITGKRITISRQDIRVPTAQPAVAQPAPPIQTPTKAPRPLPLPPTPK